MGEGNPLLDGIGVLVTRAREQAAAPASQLEKLGAKVFVLPAIKIEDLPDPEGLSEALQAIESFDHLVFSSINGVYSFLRRLGAENPTPSRMPPAICVGPKTAEVWRQSGGLVNAVPTRYTGRDLASMLGDRLEGASFLVLRPEKTETDLGGLLRKEGAKVREVVLYRTLPEEKNRADLERILEKGELDVIFFASPSAVKGVLSMGGKGDEIKDLLAVCIGPTTARAAVRGGFKKVLYPEKYTWDGMVEALLAKADEIRDRR